MQRLKGININIIYFRKGLVSALNKYVNDFRIEWSSTNFNNDLRYPPFPNPDHAFASIFTSHVL